MRRSSQPVWGCLAALLLGVQPAAAAPLEVPLLFAQEPVAGGGGRRIAGLWPDGRVRVLTAEFADAADPCVSFDGQRVLFAGRREPGAGCEIWVMAVDGSRKEQVTRGLADAREPAWLPPAAVNAPAFDVKVGWIAFTSTAAGVADERGRGALANLYAASLEPVGERGAIVWRTTYGLGGDRTPTVLADGRVLFSSWLREGYGLMTISWAGEDLNPFFGVADGPVSQLSACELPETRDVVFVEVDGDAAAAGGRLVSVSMRRPLHTRRVLADDGAWRTPARLPGGALAAAWQAPGGASFGLYRVDLATGQRGEPLYDDPAWHEVSPAAAAARPLPQGRIPMVDFASVLDVQGFERAGQLQCLNVYDSDRPELAGAAPGRVRSARLVAGQPLPLAEVAQPPPVAVAGQWPPPCVRTRPLGVVPVEADGSFYANLAGDVPFYIETLDAAGAVVGTMRAWTWVRAGDQRGCVGCHEDRELAPQNRTTDALRRARPVSLTGADAAAEAP